MRKKLRCVCVMLFSQITSCGHLILTQPVTKPQPEFIFKVFYQLHDEWFHRITKKMKLED